MYCAAACTSGTFLTIGSSIGVISTTVGGFWMDRCAVTNAEFRKFIESTEYKTTAERAASSVHSGSYAGSPR